MTAITTAASDKVFKQIEHRRARRAVKALDLAETDPSGDKVLGDPWKSQKDGKAWFDADRHPELLRK